MSEKRATERGELYDKLTPQRKMLVDMILQNLDNGAGLWKVDEINAFLKKHGITKVDVVLTGYEALLLQYGPKENLNKEQQRGTEGLPSLRSANFIAFFLNKRGNENEKSSCLYACRYARTTQ